MIKSAKVLGWFAAAMVLAVAMTASAEEVDAETIIDQAVEINSLGFESGQAEVHLSVVDSQGEERTRELDVRSRREDERSQTVMTLTNPADVRGQAFLFRENADGDDDIWMYVPAFEVTRRVEGSQRQASFLGTHFTFADLESQDLREATYEKKDDDTIGEHAVYVVEATPEDPAQSDYERVVAYVRKDDYIPLRIRYYDRDGELEKTLFTEQLETTGEGDDESTYIQRSTLRSENGGYTTIEIKSLDTEVELPSSLFDREEFGR